MQCICVSSTSQQDKTGALPTRRVLVAPPFWGTGDPPYPLIRGVSHGSGWISTLDLMYSRGLDLQIAAHPDLEE